MGNSVAKKKEKLRVREIKKEVQRRKKERCTILLIGNKGVGKREMMKLVSDIYVTKVAGRKWGNFSTFSYKLKSFVINEKSESVANLSSQYKHLSAVMNVFEQMQSGCKQINYVEPMDWWPPILISAYCNSDRDMIHQKSNFPEEICDIIIKFMGSENIDSCVYDFKGDHIIEIWNAKETDPRSLKLLFAYCSAIIFVTDISGYNEYVFDEKTGTKVNKLQNDYNLFEDLIGDMCNAKAKILLLMNGDKSFEKKMDAKIGFEEFEPFSGLDNLANDTDRYWEAMKRIEKPFGDMIEAHSKGKKKILGPWATDVKNAHAFQENLWCMCMTTLEIKIHHPVPP